MANRYATYLTPLGDAALADAAVTGTTMGLTFYALGDGNGSEYIPDPANTQLVNEVYREQINDLYIDPDNPNWIVAQFVVPANIGGFSIREIALLDSNGVTLVLGSVSTIVKPLLTDGSGVELNMKMIIDVGNAALITLIIDPSQVLATRAYVDAAVQNSVAGVPIYATFTGDGSTVNFAITNLQTNSAPSLLVTVDGVEQRWIRDYAIVLTTFTTVVFTNAPPANTDVNIRTFVSLSQSGTSEPVPTTMMARDAAGRSKVVDGVAAQDIATVGQLARTIQSQSVTAFTTTGNFPQYVFTTSPAYGPLAAGQRFRIKFNVSSGSGQATLQRDNLGFKNISQYNSSGVLTPATIIANMLADVEYDGAQYILIDALPPAAFGLNRTVLVNLASSQSATDTGSNIQPGITGVLPIANGGTGLSGPNSLLTNLGSANPDNALGTAPRPGVTGVLPFANGGTGLSGPNSMLTNLASTAPDNALATAPRPGVSGILPVANGGTGVSTITGIIKGNGAGAFTAAVANVDYATPGSGGGTTGNAATATALQNARTFQTNLASTAAASFNGTANCAPGVTGTLPIANGGTGLTAANAVLTNLGTTGAASIFAAAPRPGVTGTLPIANGGTNATTASAALSSLGGAPLNSPGFTGTPTAPNVPNYFMSTQVANMNALLNLGVFYPFFRIITIPSTFDLAMGGIYEFGQSNTLYTLPTIAYFYSNGHPYGSTLTFRSENNYINNGIQAGGSDKFLASNSVSNWDMFQNTTVTIAMFPQGWVVTQWSRP